MSHIMLYGFTSVGKTFFGKKLAQLTNLPFIDIDLTVEQMFFDTYKYYLPYNQIFAQKGVDFFRSLEAEACLNLKNEPPSLVALGGATLINHFDFLLTQGLGIYLKASFDLIYERFLTIEMPQVFKNLDKSSIEKVFNERCMIYEKFPNKRTIIIDHGIPTQHIIEQLETLIWEIIPSA